MSNTLSTRIKWPIVNLADQLEKIIDNRGKTPKKSEGGIPSLSAKSVKMGKIDYSKVYFVSDETYKNFMVRGLPKVGDVLLTTEAPLGCVARLDRDDVCLAQRLITLRGKEGVLDNDYLRFYLASPIGQHELISRASGSTVQGIKRSEFCKVDIILPPYEEQIQISSKIKSIEEKIELNRQTNQTLEEMAQAVFNSWFVDFEPTRAKVKAIQNGQNPTRAAMAAIAGKTIDQLETLSSEQINSLTATAALFPDTLVASELGEIPDGWEAKPLSNMVELIGGGTPKKSEASYWDGDIPWFSVKDTPANGDVFVIETETKITELGLSKSSTKILPEGVTIISARGTVGRLALVGTPTAMNQSCYGVKGINGIGAYLNYFNLKEAVSTLKQNTHGAVFDTITRDTFDTVMLVDASKEVKKEFENLVTPVFSQVKNALFETCSLEQLRDTLLPKLLSGEIDLSEAV